ncbi:hypothetical protein ACIA2T_19735 [Amycolatopsis japonica]|uniref:hypothetical protein n=1 Tax=Amycolatopsis japonica TaxID=208439 RepID=UPI003793DB46
MTARDFTHDVVNGPDGNWLAETLAASRDPRIKYIIWNRRILDTRPGNNPWKWMPYTGTNPHTKHVHVSVMPNASADDTTPWNLRGNPHTPTPGASRLLMSGDMITFPAEMNTRSEVISLPPDANVKLIFSAKTTIFGGHIYFWSAVNNAGTGGDPVQFRVEPKQGGVINVPRGTTKAEITYSCATPVQVFIQAIA